MFSSPEKTPPPINVPTAQPIKIIFDYFSSAYLCVNYHLLWLNSLNSHNLSSH